MNATRLVAALVGLALVAFAPRADAAAPTGVKRFALVVGSNDGGADRVRLRYAVSDAQAFATVLTQLGGVEPSDRVLLEDPSRARLVASLDDLGRRVAAARKDHRRTELVVYYSGHSDEYGLLLGPERLTYKDLRAGIGRATADVKIAILDSCASGALLREKGGHRVAPFLVDDASQISGHAFLTSSSADEAAQESDRLGASFFTHHLVSGLRGAADVSGDGRVTLNEAYQFAFQETLARTEHTRSGPQHPNYDIDLSGSGDVVITDLSQMSSTLVLDAPLSGRFFVRDSGDRLVAEVQKAATSRAIELGLQAGLYRVAFSEGGTIWSLVTALPSGQRVVLRRDMFHESGQVVAHRDRGGAPEDPPETWDDGTLPPVAPPDGPGDGPDAVVTVPIVEPAVALDPVPVRLSLLPGVSFAGPGDYQLVDGFAFGLVGDGVAGVRGWQLTMAFGIVDNFIRGAQVSGGANLSGGWVDGAQVSGGVNIAGGFVRGAQITGGANIAGQDVLGVQLSAGFNIADGYVDGFQVTGGVNIAADWVRGAQLSAGVNIAGVVEGAQVTGGVNIADDVDGVQIGLVNIGGHVEGAQIGLINIADTVDGVSIGLLPIMKNGYNHLEVWGDTRMPYNIGLRLGTPFLHFLLSAGTNGFDGSDKCVMRLGGGIGTHADVGPLYVDLDVTGHGLAGKGCDWDMYADDEILVQARLTVGLPLTDALALFIGGAANGEFALEDYDLPRPLFVDSSTTGEPGWSSHFFPSFFAGIRVF
ncbi:MAG: caspase family protein [Deltaproteobacteria bacterium]|nr:MAG: caspase family protein [Deltaproteobacteria bacterium]